MSNMDSVRILWFLGHNSFQKFELAQFKQLGITEIYMPKIFPSTENYLFLDIDYSYDTSLTIPSEYLELLNKQNWYENPDNEVWNIVNQYFDIAIIGYYPNLLQLCTKHFKGAIIFRAYGMTPEITYTKLLYKELGIYGVNKIRDLKNRFWFGVAYEQLSNSEGLLLKQRSYYLPAGLNKEITKKWTGENKSILFICPQINSSSYSQKAYENFIKNFSRFKFAVGGIQSIKVNDKHVLESFSKNDYENSLCTYRVMFYHSQDSSEIHDYPFEAVKVGMPLIFMADSLLDHYGGINLPGRCKSIREAKQKIKKILNDDWSFIQEIKKSQVVLLQKTQADYCLNYWSAGFNRILSSLNEQRAESLVRPKKKRVALIIPLAYSGGSLRGAKILANAIVHGAALCGEDIELVFAHLDKSIYTENQFQDLDSKIKLRPYKWKIIDDTTAQRAMYYAGHDTWLAEHSEYCVPDDDINYFNDCDLWLIISDRLEKPLLPIKPYVMMIYDYLSRYVNILNDKYENIFFTVARNASRVLVTTQFTRQDALQYCGLKAENVLKMPMLTPDFTQHRNLEKSTVEDIKHPYFIWTTNAAKHKNHNYAFLALKKYYEEFQGNLKCYVTGVNTEYFLKKDIKNIYYLEQADAIYRSSKKLINNLVICGELSDFSYVELLKNSAFIWHTARIDNGTFSVIEAAQLGVPALSSDYPPMQEINEQFNLELNWMDPTNPDHMALQLKYMEQHYLLMKQKLSTKKCKFKHTEKTHVQYWQVVKTCL